MKAICSWGDGPNDVLISLKGTKLVLHKAAENFDNWVHGETTEGSFALSIEEAEALANQLFDAAREARELESGWLVEIEKGECSHA